LNALNPGDYLHGRYTYLPLTGLTLILATAWHLSGKARIPFLVLAALVASAFSVLTLRQETAWRNDLTVFTAAHQIAPNNRPVALNLARTHVQEALKLVEEGQYNNALTLLNQVTTEYPDDWFAWAALGECFVQLNDFLGAERSLHRAADLSRNPQVIQEWQAVRSRVFAQGQAIADR
jgi:tetratricopeptide (TPR) repeat protein